MVCYHPHMNIQKHVYFTKNTRYYSITLEKDLLGDLVIYRNFGRIGAKKGKTIVEICDNQFQAKARFTDLCQYRMKKRHYLRVY